jgi:hypothetical protein
VNASRVLPGTALVAALAALGALWACIGDLPPLPDGQDASGADARDDLPESAALPDVASPDATPPSVTLPDAMLPDATPQDGVAIDGLAEADAGSVSAAELCAAEHDLAVRCGSDGAGCYGANEAQCSAVAQTLSDAARRAYVACVPDVQCVTGYDFLGQTCVKRALAVAAPTPEQAALRNDMCAACGGATCASDFYAISFTSGSVGAGFGLLAYSDAIVSAVDQGCVPTGPDASGDSCMDTLSVCIELVLPTLVPADACNDAGP